jgi:hypothetical protein
MSGGTISCIKGQGRLGTEAGFRLSQSVGRAAMTVGIEGRCLGSLAQQQRVMVRMVASRFFGMMGRPPIGANPNTGKRPHLPGPVSSSRLKRSP